MKGNLTLSFNYTNLLTITEFHYLLARVDTRYCYKVFLANIEQQRIDLVKLQQKYAHLKEKYRGLKERLYYAPGGEGAVAAQSHFESLAQ